MYICTQHTISNRLRGMNESSKYISHVCTRCRSWIHNLPVFFLLFSHSLSLALFLSVWFRNRFFWRKKFIIWNVVSFFRWLNIESVLKCNFVCTNVTICSKMEIGIHDVLLICVWDTKWLIMRKSRISNIFIRPFDNNRKKWTLNKLKEAPRDLWILLYGSVLRELLSDFIIAYETTYHILLTAHGTCIKRQSSVYFNAIVSSSLFIHTWPHSYIRITMEEKTLVPKQFVWLHQAMIRFWGGRSVCL